MVNVCQAIKLRHSPIGRLTFQPDPEDVQRSVDIAIVRRSAVRTDPRPYSKPCDTFRPRRRQGAARRTGLGTESFVGLNKHSPVPAGLVAEHVAEHRPACIGHGFSHPGLLQPGRVHIADDDQTVFASDLRGPFVKVVAAGVRDLCVDRTYPAFISGPLRSHKRGLVLSKMTERWNFFAGAQRRKVLEAKVNADPVRPHGKVVLNFALKRDVPSPASILDKSSALELPDDFPGFPEPISTLSVHDRVAIYFERARNERYPSERSFGPRANAEPRAPTMLIPGFCKLMADMGHSVGVNAKLGGCASGQHSKVIFREPRRRLPALPALFRLAMCGDTEVPHLIAGPRNLIQRLFADGVFDAEFVGQVRHAEIISNPKQNPKFFLLGSISNG